MASCYLPWKPEIIVFTEVKLIELTAKFIGMKNSVYLESLPTQWMQDK